MDCRIICKRLRREFNISAGVLLIYYAVMNVAVYLVAFLDAFLRILEEVRISGWGTETAEKILAKTVDNGWGYILAIATAFLCMILWKKRSFCFVEIWKSNRPMKFGAFWAILCIFISGQAFVQLYADGLEWLLNHFGLSVYEAIAAVSGGSNSISMFLYGALFAPVFEEILFRGLILKTLMPTGKKFAIFASAFFFGMFHGNIVQTPFAFALGLVLGYVATEYSLVWAIGLHMINNLVIGEVLPYVLAPLPVMGQEVIYNAINWGCAIAALVICVCKWRQIKQYLFENRMQPLCFGVFFSAPVVLVFTGVMLMNIFLFFLH